MVVYINQEEEEDESAICPASKTNKGNKTGPAEPKISEKKGNHSGHPRTTRLGKEQDMDGVFGGAFRSWGYWRHSMFGFAVDLLLRRLKIFFFVILFDGGAVSNKTCVFFSHQASQSKDPDQNHQSRILIARLVLSSFFPPSFF